MAQNLFTCLSADRSSQSSTRYPSAGIGRALAAGNTLVALDNLTMENGYGTTSVLIYTYAHAEGRPIVSLFTKAPYLVSHRAMRHGYRTDHYGAAAFLSSRTARLCMSVLQLSLQAGD